jgi:peptidoglycan hydrolase-like protein with peptidoglycan-binding domain
MAKNIIITENQLKFLIGNNIKESKEILNENETITAIQNALISKGYDVGPNGADGILGQNTRKAVLKYQKDNDIRQTGYPGKITKGKLGITTTNKSSTKPTQNTTKTQIQKKATDSVVSKNVSSNFKGVFNLDKLKVDDSTYMCKAGQKNCGQFVNDFSEKLDFVGDAWLAHDLDGVGKRVWSVYTNLSPNIIDTIYKTFINIDKAGGWKDSGPMSETIKKLNQSLTKNQPNASGLKVDDIVGIYFPSSTHHEEAFYEAGKNYFIKDKNGNLVKGKTLSGGKGFGMNTHVGIVGAIKDGVPLIFHNITGSVFSDPYNKIKGGGKIAWVKRM